VDLRAGLDGYGKSLPHRDSIPGPPSLWRFCIPTGLSRPTCYFFVLTLNCSLLKMQPEEYLQIVKHFGALVLCISFTGIVYNI